MTPVYECTPVPDTGAIRLESLESTAVEEGACSTTHRCYFLNLCIYINSIYSFHSALRKPFTFYLELTILSHHCTMRARERLLFLTHFFYSKTYF